MTSPQPQKRLMPQNLDDWPALIRATNDRPRPGDRSDPVVQEEFTRYVLRLGPLMLSDMQHLFHAVDDAHLENDYSPAGPQRCVILDGEPHAGKTYSALTKAFVETRDAWDADPGHDDPTRSRSIPWAYIEVPPAAQAYSVLLGILLFCGFPMPGGRTNATTLAAHLRQMAPQVGLRGVIIDDSHGIAGTDPRLVADILKTAVTGIPATVIMCGANLRERGVFTSLAGRQVVERATWVHAGDWVPPPKTGPVGAWAELVAHFQRAAVLPDPDAEVKLNSRAALTYLAHESLYQPGTAIRWLKRAAVHAIREQSDLDIAALKATEPRR